MVLLSAPRADAAQEFRACPPAGRDTVPAPERSQRLPREVPMAYQRVLFLTVLGLVACGSNTDGPGGGGGSPGTGSGGSGPACRAASQACAVTSDCCANLICTGNVCTAPPQCRSTGQACAVTSDCCSSLACLSNKCQTPPPADVCGDGICSGSESPASCCRDCGCPGGSTCNGTSCVAVGLSSMTWQLTDSCFDGEDIEVRYFDATDLGFWPPDPTQVYVLQQGTTESRTLACTTGAKICFGAEQPLHGFYWGLDIDASRSCAACCFTCTTTTVNPGPLTCN
jgi:hypothetical protein